MTNKAKAIYCNQSVNPASILRFAALTANATESIPLKLGNVDFWIGENAWKGQLIHDPPTYQWDKEAVQRDLNVFLTDKMDALKDYLTTDWTEGKLEISKGLAIEL